MRFPDRFLSLCSVQLCISPYALGTCLDCVSDGSAGDRAGCVGVALHAQSWMTLECLAHWGLHIHLAHSLWLLCVDVSGEWEPLGLAQESTQVA